MRTIIIYALLTSIFAGAPLAQTTDFRVEEFKFVKYAPSLTDEQRAEIFRAADQSRRRLAEAGAPDFEAVPPVLFEWPVRPAAHLDDPGYHGISSFVDHNSFYPNLLRDYNCGTRSYDLASGYNHRGTDIFLWPFLWNKMDNDDVEIVAAAAGEIVTRQDGHFDRNCGFGSGNWNGVVILHADGSIAIYAHMKSGSVTFKPVGQSVAAGEYLGVVGSSGSSTGPHLHFEVWDAGNNLIDPWQGSCNFTTINSWWIDQKPYYDSALNKISTHSSPVEWGTCPAPDVIHEADTFAPGATAYVYAYGRDAVAGDQYDVAVYKPDSTVFWSASYTFNEAPHWAAIGFSWGIDIPAAGPTGEWRYQVDYKGVKYEHAFSVDYSSAVAFSNVSAAVRDRTVRIDWTVAADEPIAGFEIYRSEGQGGEESVADRSSLGAGARSYSDGDVRSGVTYRYSVVAVKPDGSSVRSKPVAVTVGRGITALEGNFPNPFNPSTTIEYVLAEPSAVMLAVFDTRGALVAVVDEGARASGRHTAEWDGRDARGNRVGSGVYFYRLRAGKSVLTRKMVLLK
jgi:murein DD-endopeptidase MepM/ murein hydrolase activator NlpD